MTTMRKSLSLLPLVAGPALAETLTTPPRLIASSRVDNKQTEESFTLWEPL